MKKKNKGIKRIKGKNKIKMAASMPPSCTQTDRHTDRQTKNTDRQTDGPIKASGPSQ